MTRRANEQEKFARMLDRRNAALVTPTQPDPIVEECRNTSALRIQDRLAKGVPTCGHVREDGLGYCGDDPDSIVHDTSGPHGHKFRQVATISATAGRAALADAEWGR